MKWCVLLLLIFVAAAKAAFLPEPALPKLSADQIYGTVFKLRADVRQRTSIKGKIYVTYRWFVRNALDREVLVAFVRQQPAPRDLYGNPYPNTFDFSGSADLLYSVIIKDGAGWSQHSLPESPPNELHDTQWLPLQPQEEREIYSRVVPSDKLIKAVIFSIPFQADNLSGNAMLCSTLHD